jgi:hypothetical protein
MPLHDPEVFHPIPAKIEAENYNTMSGILLQLTNDVSGFSNVGYIDAGDWMMYGIDVPEAGTYYLSARIASTKEASAKLLVNEEEIETLSIDNTGGWQKWKTITIPITLEAGEQYFKLKAVTNGFNVNWIRFSVELILGNEEESENVSVAYPNPVMDKLYIKSPENLASIEILDFCGRQIYKENPTPIIDLTDFVSGVYIIRLIQKNGKIVTDKIIRK